MLIVVKKKKGVIPMLFNLFSKSPKKKYANLNYKRTMSDAEAVMIYNSFNEKEMNYKCVWGLLMATGCRINEVMPAKLEWFNDDMTIFRYKVLKKKKEEWDTKFLPKQLSELLLLYKKMNYPIMLRNNNYFFATENPNSKKYFLQDKSMRWKLWQKRNELNLTDYIINKQKFFRINLHTPRHWVATKIIKRYGLKYAQEYLNHVKVETTQKYCDKLVDDKKKREIIEKCFAQFFENKPLISKSQQRLSSFL